MAKKLITQQKDFGTELQALKMKAGELALWRTMHALDEATKVFITDFKELKETADLNKSNK